MVQELRYNLQLLLLEFHKDSKHNWKWLHCRDIIADEIIRLFMDWCENNTPIKVK